MTNTLKSLQAIVLVCAYLIQCIRSACDPTCQTCDTNSDPTKCLTCSANRKLSGIAPNTCICLDKFYLDSGTGTCKPCDPTCKTCSSSSATSCLSCEYGAELKPTGDCKCTKQNSYMVLNTGACMPCHYSCATCTDGTANGCIGSFCRVPSVNPAGPYFSSPNGNNIGTCTCGDGYSIDPLTGACVKCYPTCKKCSNTLSIGCTECYPGMIAQDVPTITAQICTCPSGQSFDLSLQICTSCGGDCLTCFGTGANQCTSCFSGADLLFDNTCRCQKGFQLDRVQAKCVQQTISCHVTCLTCTGTGRNECSSCKTNAILTNEFICACIEGFTMITSTGNCVPCSKRCKTCLPNNPNKCSSCASTSLVPLFLDTSLTTCFCAGAATPEGTQFVDPLFTSCTSCNPICRTCELTTSTSACSSCRVSAYYDSTDVNVPCKCPIRHTLSTTTGACIPPVVCPVYCNECKITPTRCDDGKCKTFSSVSSTSGQCICEIGFSMLNKWCTVCSPGCGTCTTSAAQCTTCLNTMDYTLTPSGTCDCSSVQKFKDSLDGKCKICHFTCSSCINGESTTCKSCPNGGSVQTDSLGNSYCLQPANTHWNGATSYISCNNQCTSCSGVSSSECTSCKSVVGSWTALLQSTQICLCPLNMYMDTATGTCSSCHTSCRKCVGPSATQCTECDATAIQLTGVGSCVCAAGKQLDAVNGICYSCHYTCATCVSYSMNPEASCITCKPTAIRLVSGTTPTKCVCDVGYTMDNTGNCFKCHPTCDKCIGQGAYGCSVVKDASNAMLPTNMNIVVCNLDSKYVDQMTGMCNACSTTCKRCSGPAATQCTACASGLLLIGGSCVVPTGYYLSGTSLIKCHNSCKECIDSTINGCTSCFQFASRSNPSAASSSCVCISGYDYGASTTTYLCRRVKVFSANPQMCHTNCDDCSVQDDNTKCTSCPNNAAYLSTTSVCVCNPGYGLNYGGAGRCFACASACKTCAATDLTACTSCYSTDLLSFDPATCACKPGWFLDLTTNICTKCHITCATCSGPLANDCLTCRFGSTIDSKGFFGCETKSFYDDTSNSCKPCTSPCSRCSVIPTACLACDTSIPAFIYTTDGKCTCPTLYTYSAPSSCVPVGSACDSTCADGLCTGTASNQCIECKKTDSIMLDGTCYCIFGTAWDSATRSCLPCHYSCRTCATTSSSRCLTCKRGAVLGAVSSGVCSCPTGYTMSSDINQPLVLGECVPACTITKCSICDTPDKCKVCQDDFVVVNGVCVCPPGTYGDTTYGCKFCHTSCATCNGGTSTSCLTCKADATLSATITPTSCKCTATNKYMDGTGTCLSCFRTCGTCTNGMANGCVTCIDSTYELKSDNTCRLKSDIVDVCYPSCATCSGTSSNDCTSCKPNTMMMGANFPTACGCSAGKYLHVLEGNCYPCHSSCLTCTGGGSTECLSCYPPSTLTAKGSCDCPINVKTVSGPSSSCTAITTFDATCKTYVGSTINDCFTCKTYAYQEDEGNRCICKYGYTFNNIKDCELCDPTCVSCNAPGSFGCTVCRVNSYLDTDGSCKCSRGYTLGSGGLCVPITCHYSCQTCFDGTANGCLTCKLGSYMNADNSCTCLPNTFRDLDGSCSTCSPTCQTCYAYGNDKCLTCKPFSAIVQGRCVCRMGYFSDPNQNGDCSPCDFMSACLTCKGTSTTCVSCKEGSLPTNPTGQCIPSPSNQQIDSTGQFTTSGCAKECRTCLSNQLTVCTACRPYADLQSDGTCVCRNGYKVNALGTCDVINCDVSCATCVGQKPTDCTSCRLGSMLETSVDELKFSSCVCVLGYGFDDNGDCKPCDATCQTCTRANKQGCILCRPGLEKQPDGSCACPKGYYFSSNLKCEPCYFTCETCTAGTSGDCITCKSLAFLTIGPLGNFCACDTDYVRMSDGSCSYRSCDYTCRSCTGPGKQECYTCRPDAYLASDNTCSCRSGQPQDPAGNCALCNPTCAICSPKNINMCLSCFPLAILYRNNTCACKAGYYFDPAKYSCLLCHSSCATCTGPNSNQCLSCKGRSVTLTLSNQCICTGGITMNSEGSCSQCSASCYTCDLRGGCASCGNNAALTSKKTCVCNVGYYMNVDGNCARCNAACQACTGPTEKECVSCGYGLSGEGASCKCPMGQYWNLLDNKCSDCSKALYCATCNNDYECVSCIPGYKLTSTRTCKKIFYEGAFDYKIEIIHDQLIFYINNSGNKDQNREYLRSVVADDFLSISKLNADGSGEPGPSQLSWKVTPQSEYEWEKGIVRFSLQYSDSCEAFNGIVEALPVNVPPAGFNSLNFDNSGTRIRSLQIYSLTNNKPKIYQIPTYIFISSLGIFNWYAFFSSLYAVIIAVMIFSIILRPFFFSLRYQIKTFWVVQNIMWFQFLSLFGFSSTEFRGSLDEILLGISKASLRYFGLEYEFIFTKKIDDIRNGHYVGKYTAENQTPYVFEKMFIPVIVYLLVWIASVIPIKRKIQEMIVSLRVAIGYCYIVQFAYLIGVNWISFSNAKAYNAYTISGLVMSILLFLLCAAEVFINKFQISNNGKFGLTFEQFMGIVTFDIVTIKEEVFDPRSSRWTVFTEADCLIAGAFVMGLSGRSAGAQSLTLLMISVVMIVCFLCTNQQYFKWKFALMLCFHFTCWFMLSFAYFKRDITVKIAESMHVIFLIVFMAAFAFIFIILSYRIRDLLRFKLEVELTVEDEPEMIKAAIPTFIEKNTANITRESSQKKVKFDLDEPESILEDSPSKISSINLDKDENFNSNDFKYRHAQSMDIRTSYLIKANKAFQEQDISYDKTLFDLNSNMNGPSTRDITKM